MGMILSPSVCLFVCLSGANAWITLHHPKAVKYVYVRFCLRILVRNETTVSFIDRLCKQFQKLVNGSRITKSVLRCLKRYRRIP